MGTKAAAATKKAPAEILPPVNATGAATRVPRVPARNGLTLSDLVADPQNRRLHNPRNLKMIRESLAAVGTARSIVIDEDNVVLAGNGVTQAAAKAGIKLRVVDAEGDELIAVRRTGLSAEQKRALAIYDNRTAELATWDFDQLDKDKAAGLEFTPFWNDGEVAQIFPETPAAPVAATATPGDAPLPAEGEALPPDDDAVPDATQFHVTALCDTYEEQLRAVRALQAEAISVRVRKVAAVAVADDNAV